MTAMTQDFSMVAGDAFQAVFTVRDASGNAVDISASQDIIWTAQLDLSTPVALTKKKTVSSGVTFVTTGSDGKFQVNFASADTTSLTGYYLYQAQIIDSSGTPSTVATGRVQFGVGPAWTYSGDPTKSAKDAVRYLIGDTDSSDPLVKDPEILFAIGQRSSNYGAAAFICSSLAAKFSRQADTGDRDMRTNLSQRAASFRAMAKDYETKAASKFSATSIAGLLRPFA